MYNASGTLNKDQLVTQFAPLVKRIAYHLMAKLPASVEVEDLIQNGMMGLLDAIGRFEEGLGAQFETYAVQRIRGEVRPALRAVAPERSPGHEPSEVEDLLAAHDVVDRDRDPAGRRGDERHPWRRAGVRPGTEGEQAGDDDADDDGELRPPVRLREQPLAEIAARLRAQRAFLGVVVHLRNLQRDACRTVPTRRTPWGRRRRR
jgi:RNA polymerase sigma factor (sigma-70 family)